MQINRMFYSYSYRFVKDRYMILSIVYNNLNIDTINQTPIDLPYGKAGSKPYCNHF